MRKKCRRKIYGLVNPITHAIEGACITPDDKLEILRKTERAALAAFASGTAKLQHWADINESLCLCETLALGGIGREALESCKAAEAGLLDAKEQLEKTGAMKVSDETIKAFCDFCEYLHLQRTSIARSEFEGWISKTRNRMRSKGPGVIEI